MDKEKVSIRPSVGYLSILQAINYRAWYAMAEFVDNSLIYCVRSILCRLVISGVLLPKSLNHLIKDKNCYNYEGGYLRKNLRGGVMKVEVRG